MQITCQKCGHGNPMGHLFCVKCSAKLDLSHVDEDLEDDIESQGRGTAVKAFLLLVLIAMLVVVGIAAWPQSAFDAKKLDNGSAGRVENTLIALNMVAQRPSGSITTRPPLDQIDANAWLASANSIANVKSTSVSFKRDRLTFRVVRTIGPYQVWQFQIPRIPYSMDLVGKPEKGTLKIVGAQVGHMPIPGRVAKYITGFVRKTLTGMSREKTIFDSLSEIKIDDGQLIVTVTGRS